MPDVLGNWDRRADDPDYNTALDQIQRPAAPDPDEPEIQLDYALETKTSEGWKRIIVRDTPEELAVWYQTRIADLLNAGYTIKHLSTVRVRRVVTKSETIECDLSIESSSLSSSTRSVPRS